MQGSYHELTPSKNEDFNVVGFILAYEEGCLPDELVLEGFQKLVNLGVISHLQGHYGRMAEEFIRQGLISPKQEESA